MTEEARDIISLPEPKHSKMKCSPEECVGNLAMGMGMLIASSGNFSHAQAGCFMYSVWKLAAYSGVDQDHFISAFAQLGTLGRQVCSDFDQEIEAGIGSEGPNLEIGIHPETKAVVLAMTPSLHLSISPEEAIELAGGLVQTAKKAMGEASPE